MKKLFLFLTAALFATSLWATDVTESRYAKNDATGMKNEGTYVKAVTLGGNASWSSNKLKIGSSSTGTFVVEINSTYSSSYTIKSITFSFDGSGRPSTFSGNSIAVTSNTNWSAGSTTPTKVDFSLVAGSSEVKIKQMDITLTPAGEDVTAPTLSSSTPVNNASGVAVSGNIVLTFSENVTINDASKFSISPSTGVTLNTPTVNGAVVTIPYSGLANLTQYTFSTAAEAVKDGANLKNAALSDIVFTTICEAPASALVLSSDAAADVYVGDVITFSTSGGNGSAITLEGGNGETISDGKWTATLGEHTFTASQEISEGKCAQESEISFTVLPSAICPSGLSITGTQVYTEYENISLTAELSAGNGTITYNWYKGADLAAAKAAGSIGTGTTYSKASCAPADAGNYYCIASKDDCDDAESAAYAVTVTGLTFCYTFTPKEVTEDEALSDGATVATSNGGSMVVVDGSTMHYTTNGLYFETNSSTKVDVTLSNKMKVGTVIVAVVWSNNTGSARTLKLNTSTGDTKATWSFTPSSASGEEKTYTYVVKAGDGLVDTNKLQLQRGSNIYLRSFKVGNCGADVPTDIEEVVESASAVKVLENGMLIIEKNGVRYNAMGQIIR